MSRRRPPGELQFGSDSFLDVVANIVGILIILIVIAGLRVSKMPVGVVTETTSETVETIPMPIAAAAESPASNEQAIASIEPIEEIVEEPEIELELPPLPPLVVPQELVKLTNQIESDIAALREKEARLAEQFKQSTDQQTTLEERQRAIQALLAEKKKQIDDSRKNAAVVEADIELARATLIRLTKQVRELESEPVNVETLEHKVTPISRVVNGKEKHYRLEKNRVAEVPIDDLVTRFREQIDRRKDWLAKTKHHQGQIGPIRGFNMNYVVKVDTMSELDALRAGYGGYRISLAQWEVHPEPDLKGETEQVALRKGSQFYQSILAAGPETTLTFWVYPDSYELYRKLQKFTHEHGFSVAARPLPAGVPIAGSPNGSKSASQ